MAYAGGIKFPRLKCARGGSPPAAARLHHGPGQLREGHLTGRRRRGRRGGRRRRSVAERCAGGEGRRSLCGCPRAPAAPADAHPPFWEDRRAHQAQSGGQRGRRRRRWSVVRPVAERGAPRRQPRVTTRQHGQADLAHVELAHARRQTLVDSTGYGRPRGGILQRTPQLFCYFLFSFRLPLRFSSFRFSFSLSLSSPLRLSLSLSFRSF